MSVELVPQSTDVASGSNAQLLKALKDRKALQDLIAGGTAAKPSAQQAAPAFAPSNLGQAAFGYAGVAANALGDRAVLEREKADQAKRMQVAAEGLKSMGVFPKEMPTAAIMGVLMTHPEAASQLMLKQYEVMNRKPEFHPLSPGQSGTVFDPSARPGMPPAPPAAAAPAGPPPMGGAVQAPMPAAAPPAQPSPMPAAPAGPMPPPMAGDPRVRVAIPGKSLAEVEFEKGYGEGMNKQALATLERGNTAAVQKQKISLASQMMNEIETGKLTPAKSTVGGYMQALGIDPKLLGIDPKTPMTAQALSAITSDLVIGKLGAGGFPSNNFSNADREFLTQGVFNLADTPQANKMKLEVARRVAELDERKANAWAQARKSGHSYEDFEAGWRDGLGKQNIFADLIEQAKGMSGGGQQISLGQDAGLYDITGGQPSAPAPPADPLGIR